MTEGDTKANGRIITWKDMESTHGKMEEVTKANIKKIKSMATEYTPGLMEEDTKDGGIKPNNLV